VDDYEYPITFYSVSTVPIKVDTKA